MINATNLINILIQMPETKEPANTKLTYKEEPTPSKPKPETEYSRSSNTDSPPALSQTDQDQPSKDIMVDINTLVEQKEKSITYIGNFGNKGYRIDGDKGVRLDADNKAEFGEWKDDKGAYTFTPNAAVEEDVRNKVTSLKKVNIEEQNQKDEFAKLIKEINDAACGNTVQLKKADERKKILAAWKKDDPTKFDFAKEQKNSAEKDILLNAFLKIAEPLKNDKKRFGELIDAFSNFSEDISKDVNNNARAEDIYAKINNFLNPDSKENYSLAQKGFKKDELAPGFDYLTAEHNKNIAETTAYLEGKGKNTTQTTAETEPNKDAADKADTKDKDAEKYENLAKGNVNEATKKKYEAIKEGLKKGGQIGIIAAMAVTVPPQPLGGVIAAVAIYWWNGRKGRQEKELDAAKELEEFEKFLSEKEKGTLGQAGLDQSKDLLEQMKGKGINKEDEKEQTQPQQMDVTSEQGKQAAAFHEDALGVLQSAREDNLTPAQKSLQQASGLNAGTVTIPEPVIMEPPAEAEKTATETASPTAKKDPQVLDTTLPVMSELSPAAPVVEPAPAPEPAPTPALDKTPALTPAPALAQDPTTEVKSAPALDVDAMPTPVIPAPKQTPAPAPAPSVPSKIKTTPKENVGNIDVQTTKSQIELAKAALFGDKSTQETALERLERKRSSSNEPNQNQH